MWSNRSDVEPKATTLICSIFIYNVFCNFLLFIEVKSSSNVVFNNFCCCCCRCASMQLTIKLKNSVLSCVATNFSFIFYLFVLNHQPNSQSINLSFPVFFLLFYLLIDFNRYTLQLWCVIPAAFN